MAKPKLPPMATDDEVRAFLQRYRCPAPFHAVRTRFLGNIATPGRAGLANGDDGGAVGRLVADVREPGRRQRTDRRTGDGPLEPPHQASGAIGAVSPGAGRNAADTRGHGAARRNAREELEGFICGLFGDQETLDFPERAHRGLEVLANLRDMFKAVQELGKDPAKPAPPADIAITLGHLRELTRIAEREMHEVVLSCTHARRQRGPALKAAKPVLH